MPLLCNNGLARGYVVDPVDSLVNRPVRRAQLLPLARGSGWSGRAA
jgi:hypothetical protein